MSYYQKYLKYKTKYIKSKEASSEENLPNPLRLSSKDIREIGNFELIKLLKPILPCWGMFDRKDNIVSGILMIMDVALMGDNVEISYCSFDTETISLNYGFNPKCYKTRVVSPNGNIIFLNDNRYFQEKNDLIKSYGIPDEPKAQEVPKAPEVPKALEVPKAPEVPKAKEPLKVPKEVPKAKKANFYELFLEEARKKAIKKESMRKPI